jgi:hypothetical protein
MPEHVDRDRSKAAISKKIKEEEAELKKTEDWKKQREADHQDTSYQDEKIAKEKAKIAGKREILRIVDEFGQLETVDEEIERERKMLSGKKAEIAELRRQQPKDTKGIAALDKEIELLTEMIAGKDEARGALVF